MSKDLFDKAPGTKGGKVNKKAGPDIPVTVKGDASDEFVNASLTAGPESHQQLSPEHFKAAGRQGRPEVTGRNPHAPTPIEERPGPGAPDIVKKDGTQGDPEEKAPLGRTSEMSAPKMPLKKKGK